jgi:hypothetical protein
MKKILLLLLLVTNLVIAESSEERFHDEIIARLEGSKDFMTLLRTAPDGKPFSFFFIIAPSDITQHIMWNKNKGDYLYLRAITLRYGDLPQYEYITAKCKEKKIDKKCVEGRGCSSKLLPELDTLTGEEITVDNKVLRYLHFNMDMTKQEYADFCQIDYSDAISYVDNAFMKYHSE